MAVDIESLAAFYKTPLGEAAQRLVLARVRVAWPSVTGLRVLGYGFAAPYLFPFHGHAERVVAALPYGETAPGEAEAHAAYWLPSARNASTLVAETAPAVSRRDVRSHPHGARAGDLRSRAALHARDLARAGARRPPDHGGAEPRQPVVAVRDHAVRLRPALHACAIGAASGAIAFCRRGLGCRADAAAVFPRQPPPSASRARRDGNASAIASGRAFAGVHLVEATKSLYAAMPGKPQSGARRRVLAGAERPTQRSALHRRADPAD